ncbi:Acyl-CoA dehydrogenase [hydrothermal vent metagenome]|uniref:Acyl-CoA dehydrogenase n=1 Tax=hydrothermal vent metagenome TaxID=652676 RepID=A0A3B1AR82_9ZZZZ
MPIDFNLTKEQIQIRNIACEMAAVFAMNAEEHDKNRSSPIENYSLLKDAGFFGLSVPKQYGGMGAGLLGWVIACEELAKGCCATTLAFNMHINSVGFVMENKLISEKVKKRVAEEVIKKSKLLCYAVSEPSTSSLIISTCAPSVKAKKVSGGYILNGCKAFISNWEASDYAYMYAREEDDPNPDSAVGLLVPTKSQGAKVTDWWHTLGMRATRSQKINLEDVFVPQELLLHRTENFIEFFVSGGPAWSFGAYTAVYLGVGLAILDEAKRLLKARVPKGYSQSIGYHPDIRRKITQMSCMMEAAQHAMYKAAWVHEHEPDNLTKILASLFKAKYVVGESVAKTAQLATSACGLHALFKGEKLERLIRDATTAPIMPPNSDSCASLIGLLELGLDINEALDPLKQTEAEVFRERNVKSKEQSQQPVSA